jgi:hypothetical protein
MRPHDIKCRLCGHRYNDPEGCEVCVLAKKNIIWPESDLPLLESLAAQGIRLIEQNMNRLEEDMAAGTGSFPFEKHIRMACDLNRALTAILGEARKLEDKAAREVSNKSLAEKAEMMLDWLVHELPQEHQERFLESAIKALQEKNTLLIGATDDD